MAVLLFLQPVADVVSYWFQEWGFSSLPTLALRFGMLGISLLAGFWLSEKKRAYLLGAAALVVLGAGHAFACLQAPGGYQDPLPDLINLVRIAQLPVLTLCFITFFRQNPRAFAGAQAGLALALGFVFLVALLSRLTGTDPKTYSDGLGVLGWFAVTSSQSAILSMLAPLVSGWLLARRNTPCFWASLAIGLGMLFLFGTRLTYLGIYATTVGLGVSLLLTGCRAHWKTAGVLFALAVVFTLLIPYSTMGHHLRADGSAQNRRQDAIYEILGEDKARVDLLKEKQAAGTLGEAEHQWLVGALTPVYEKYERDFVEIFGAEKTMEMFHYTYDIFTFYDVRYRKLLFARTLMDTSPASTQIFGLDYSRFLVGDNVYDVENDLHGIYYLCGGAGLGALAVFFGYFVYLVFRALWQDFRRYFTVEAASLGIAFLTCLAHIVNTSGVLRRPNASVYLSFVLAGIYYLVKVKVYPQPAKGQRKIGRKKA
nr:O-antigen ligase family protein [Acutalibacter sp. M00118]